MKLGSGFHQQTYHKRQRQRVRPLRTPAVSLSDDWSDGTVPEIEWSRGFKNERRISGTFTRRHTIEGGQGSWPTLNSVGMGRRKAEPLEETTAFKQRLQELDLAAADEGVEVNASSIVGLTKFIKLSAAISMPSIVLRPNGNIRAVWLKEGRQLGIQFFGFERCSYVIFGGANNEVLSNHYGECDIDQMMNIILALDMTDLFWQ